MSPVRRLDRVSVIGSKLLEGVRERGEDPVEHAIELLNEHRGYLPIGTSGNDIIEAAAKLAKILDTPFGTR